MSRKLHDDWNAIMEVTSEEERMQTIPYLDIRNGTSIDLLATHSKNAKDIISACGNTFGIASQLLAAPALAMGDHYSRLWLDKTNNPYKDEIAAIASQLNMRGIYALNMCFEWGCTSSVYKVNGSAVLARVLDWPFPKMGENIVVAHQRGAAGDFYNVTWPGVSGVFTGMAPGKFAISLNQAPMQRHGLGFVGDWAKNRSNVWQSRALPPAHLLRHVFETARSYDEAKAMLAATPIALPVIFTLSGITTEQGCVIERLENDAVIREIGADRVCVSNQFESRFNAIGKGWLAREIDSAGRMKKANETPIAHIDNDFTWFAAPVANAHSCLAMIADAGKGTLSVMGTKGAQRVTNIFTL